MTEVPVSGHVLSATLTGPLGTGPINLPSLSSHETSLVISLALGAPKGEYCFEIELTGPNFPTVTCEAKLTVAGPIITVRELGGHDCALAGNIVSKTYRITNLTGVQRTVDWTVTSTQFTSSNGNEDHFPIALCGGTLMGDPADPNPPTISNSAMVPAGAGSFVDVCIDTRSFPQCHEGSSCHLEIVVIDQVEPQCVVRARTDTTVLAPGWNKNFPTRPVPAMPEWAMALMGLTLVGATATLLRKKTRGATETAA